MPMPPAGERIVNAILFWIAVRDTLYASWFSSVVEQRQKLQESWLSPRFVLRSLNEFQKRRPAY